MWKPMDTFQSWRAVVCGFDPWMGGIIMLVQGEPELLIYDTLLPMYMLQKQGYLKCYPQSWVKGVPRVIV